MREAVVLIGHGGAQRRPRELLMELRRPRGALRTPLGAHEREPTIRCATAAPPRDRSLPPRPRRAGAAPPRAWRCARQVVHNEFCAPSVANAVDDLVGRGWTRIVLLTTMVTPGGSHAERDIPQHVDAARRHPGIDYLWPLDLERVAELIAAHVERP
jgi:sirohydrochlorin cobaltochelatase